MKICLNMIVKDEASVIERCLASVKPVIDHWVIVDTGSTDGTQDIIRRFMTDIPGELHERLWRNFGDNRTEALELARDHGDYLLFIDADEQLRVDTSFDPAQLKEDAYSLATFFGNLIYDRVNLVKSQLPWKWCGVLHEYLDAGRPVQQPRIQGLGILVTPDGARSHDPKKFEKDAALLEEALQSEPHNAAIGSILAKATAIAASMTKPFLRMKSGFQWVAGTRRSGTRCCKLLA